MSIRGACFILFILSSICARAQLALDFPVGGEIFYTTKTDTIRLAWSGVDDTTKVRLEYSTDGRIWRLIADSVTGNGYTWNVVGLPISSSYRVRVAQVRPPQVADNITYTGHTSDVFDADWSPSGLRIASVAAEVHIWDADSGGSTPLVALPAPTATYASVRWSTDSARIVTASDDGQARVFDARQNTLALTLNHQQPLKYAEFNSTQDLVLTNCQDNRVRLFRPPGTVAVSTLNPVSTIEQSLFSPDGRRVLVCANDARIYPVAPGIPLTFNKHTSGVLGGAWSPDGQLVATVGGDATVRLWDANSAVERWVRSDAKEGVRYVAFSHDGKRIAVGMSDSTVTVWDVATGDLVKKIGGHTNTVRFVQFSPDDQLVASASDDNSARVYDFRSDVSKRYPHTNDVTIAKWNPDGTRLLTASKDKTAIVWRVQDVTLQGDTSGVFSIASPPPSFAQFYATGDTFEIGEQTTINVELRGAQALDLADIDSVALTLDYDATMLDLISTSVPITSTTDSSGYETVVMSTIELPLADALLFTATFRGTLGADSITTFRFKRIRQIGAGPGVQVTTHSDTILVRGICRAGGNARLYIPVGAKLGVVELPDRDRERVEVEISLEERGPTSFMLYSLNGDMLWQELYTPSTDADKQLTRSFDRSLIGSYAVLVVVAPSNSISKVIGIGHSR